MRTARGSIAISCYSFLLGMSFATTSGVSSNAALPPLAEMIVSSLSGNDKLTSYHDVLSDAAFHTGTLACEGY